MTRALSTVAGAALAGGLIWIAAQMDSDATGGYWAQIGLLAAAGLGLALARLPDVGMRTLVPSLPTFGLAFIPSLVAAGWIVAAQQPHGNWVRGHVLDWSGDIGLTRVMRDLGPYAIVLAFGVGVVLGLVFERRAAAVTPPAKADYERDETLYPPSAEVESEETRNPELVGHS
jgi:hypothetical protein